MKSVRDGTFPYVHREETKRDWYLYDRAQIDEIADVLETIRNVVDIASYLILGKRGVGRPPVPAPDLVKVMLMQAYFGMPNRVAKDFLIRISDNKRSRKQFEENCENFGKLFLLSDLNEEPDKIYRLYKWREYVEYAFNVYKNDLEADRSYLRDDHMMFTYMFLNLLSLYLQFQILNMIDEKYGVRDVLLILSRIKIYRMEEGEINSELPKKTRELVSDMKIDLDILCKNA